MGKRGERKRTGKKKRGRLKKEVDEIVRKKGEKIRPRIKKERKQ